MNNQRALLSFVMNNVADDQLAVLCVEKLTGLFAHIRAGGAPTVHDSANVRDAASAFLAKLSGKPETTIRVETHTLRKVYDNGGLDRRLYAKVLPTMTPAACIHGRHLRAISDGMEKHVTSEVMELVSYCVSEINVQCRADAFSPDHRSYIVGLIQLLVLSALRQHSGGFSFAVCAIDLLSKVTVLGSEANGTWHLIVA